MLLFSTYEKTEAQREHLSFGTKIKVGIQSQAVPPQGMLSSALSSVLKLRWQTGLMVSSGLFIFCYSLGRILALNLYLHSLVLFCFVYLLFVNITFQTVTSKTKKEKRAYTYWKCFLWQPMEDMNDSSSRVGILYIK